MKLYAPLTTEAEPLLQKIEVESFFQIPKIQIVGLPSKEVAEAKERIRSAIVCSGFKFPRRKVILNLSPASVRKRGTGTDLPMALAVLVHAKNRSQNSADWTESRPFSAWGELGLGGEIRSVGQITRAIFATWKAGIPSLLLPKTDLEEAESILFTLKKAACLEGPPPNLCFAENLTEAWKRCQGLEVKTANILSFRKKKLSNQKNPIQQHSRHLLPLSPVLERIAGVAVSGGHHLIILGPKGSGKTHFIEWISTLSNSYNPEREVHRRLLSELSPELDSKENPLFDSQEEGARWVSPLSNALTLRGSVSNQGIRAGDFSLAHKGLLIADEIMEWKRECRESLREPLEFGRVTLPEKKGSVVLPAQFTLAASGNLCPCGGWPAHFFFDDAERVNALHRGNQCSCTKWEIRTYLKRLSRAVLDRIDFSILLLQKQSSTQSTSHSDEAFTTLKRKVDQSQTAAKALYGAQAGLLSARQVEEIMEKHHWKDLPLLTEQNSLRSRHKVVRIALTLGLWDGYEVPKKEHFIEALSYRQLGN